MSYIKSNRGHFFEDFKVGQTLIHGVPRTITESDATLYLALTGSRFALHCASTVAKTTGFKSTPLDNLLVFHIAFGKTVNDISLNAVANLGYAEILFQQPCYTRDTLSVTSEVIGLKENSSGKTGVVYVHSIATNQNSETVLQWKRWVMVKKNNINLKTDELLVPQLKTQVDYSQQNLPKEIDFKNWQDCHSDYQLKYNDMSIGETIIHPSAMTINDSDHSLATRLYQNNAQVHFDQAMMNNSPHGKRLVYGGHIISICRALSYNGLGNALWLSAINSGAHCNPSFSDDTIYSQSTILDKIDIKERNDIALVRIQMIGTKNIAPEKIETLFKKNGSRKKYNSNVVLDLDYSVLVLK
jgi:2-methylfumaryl-CoA hydratase